MARIEIRKPAFSSADVLVGNVDLEPAITFRQRRMLETAASTIVSGFDATGRALDDVRRGIGGLDERMEDVAVAISRLEAELGFRLLQQTRLLDQQVVLLEEIAETLRTPARVRAAEQLHAAGELLRRRRFQRALEAAERAVADDANNPAAFRALGWAWVGLAADDKVRSDALRNAQHAFGEEAEASDGLRIVSALQRAARITFELDGAAAALGRLPASLDIASDDVEEAERAASMSFDAAVYCAAGGDIDLAIRWLTDAITVDARYTGTASRDEELTRHPDVIAAAEATADEVWHGVGLRRARIKRMLDDLAHRAQALKTNATSISVEITCSERTGTAAELSADAVDRYRRIRIQREHIAEAAVRDGRARLLASVERDVEEELAAFSEFDEQVQTAIDVFNADADRRRQELERDEQLHALLKQAVHAFCRSNAATHGPVVGTEPCSIIRRGIFGNKEWIAEIVGLPGQERVEFIPWPMRSIQGRSTE